MNWEQFFDPGYNPYAGIFDQIDHPWFKAAAITLMFAASASWIEVGLIIVGVWFMWRGRRKSFQKSKDKEETSAGPRYPGLISRLWDEFLILLRIRKPKDLQRIDGHNIDRRKVAHMAFGGPTGSGKTNAVAATRIDGKRPTVIVTFDFSGPILGAVQALERKKPGSTITWTPQGNVGLDLFQGTPREIARRWSSTFGEIGIGQHQRAARARMTRAIEEIDAEGTDRNAQEFINRINPKWRKETCVVCQQPLDGHPKKSHPEQPYPDALTNLEKNAVESWLLRLEDLVADLAPEALGHDLDIAKALQAGRTVFLHVDAAVQDGTLQALVGIFVQENIRCIRKVRGGFRVIIEEAGAVVSHLEGFRLLLQAGRVRGVHVDVILQSLADLPPFFRQNVTGWVLFSQEEDKEKRAAASRTGLKPFDFDSGVLKKYWCWVKIGPFLKLVKFPVAPEAHYQIDWDDETTVPEEFEDELEVTVDGHWDEEWDTEESSLDSVDDPEAEVLNTERGYSTVDEDDVPPIVGKSLQRPTVPPLYLESKVAPKDQKQLRRIWERHNFVGECHESTYRLNSSGRPQASFQGRDWVTYILIRALSDAVEQGLDEKQTAEYLKWYQELTTNQNLTVHHECENEVCDNPEHLRGVQRGKNTEMWWDGKLQRVVS